jgi:hypothetical protein
MDVFVSVVLFMVSAMFGYLGAIVPLQKRSAHSLGRLRIYFGLLSLAGLALGTWQALRASQSSEENRKAFLGDPERPSYVSVISLPSNTRFVRVNPSDYPAYGVYIQLYDDADKTNPMRKYTPTEMAAHTAIADEQPWTPNDNLEHHFTAQIGTRTGVVYEELVLRPAGNNQWMKACRVRQGMRTLEEDVDSSWPRDKNGQVEWN